MSRWPRQFNGLAGFLARCEREIAAHGDDVVVMFGYTRRLQRTWLQFTPNVRVNVIGWDAEAAVSICEIPAATAIQAAADGYFVDRFELPTPEAARVGEGETE